MKNLYYNTTEKQIIFCDDKNIQKKFENNHSTMYPDAQIKRWQETFTDKGFMIIRMKNMIEFYINMNKKSDFLQYNNSLKGDSGFEEYNKLLIHNKQVKILNGFTI